MPKIKNPDVARRKIQRLQRLAKGHRLRLEDIKDEIFRLEKRIEELEIKQKSTNQ